MRDFLHNFKHYTMTSFPRMNNFCDCLEFVLKNNIEGDIVECGVWKGGNIMIASKILKENKSNRFIWAYDTFEGMTEPEDCDVDRNGIKGKSRYQKGWCKIDLETVKKNLSLVGYNNIKYIVGDVLKTIPKNIPDKISVLRLDTDFYKSTKHEIEHLYNKVVSKGFIIIDDYNSWSGSKKATDELLSHEKLIDIDGEAVYLQKE